MESKRLDSLPPLPVKVRNLCPSCIGIQGIDSCPHCAGGGYIWVSPYDVSKGEQSWVES